MIQRLTGNLGFKILSLILASLFWLLATRDAERVALVNIPVQFRNLPRDLELTSEVAGSVSVELRGHARNLNPAGLANASVAIDLAAVHRPGDRTFPVQGSAVQLPAGVTLLRAIPGQLRLTFDNRLAREVPVRLRLSKGTRPGYDILSNTVVPETLTIVGPETRVKEIESVETDPIDLSTLETSTDLTVQAYVADPLVRFDGRSTVIAKFQIHRTEDAGK